MRRVVLFSDSYTVEKIASGAGLLTQNATSERPPYRAFGTLRFVLALLVVMGHAAWILRDSFIGPILFQFRPGTPAVLTFFALSGFILTEAADTFYRGKPRRFAQNRMLKILPTFFGALVMSLAVHVICAANGVLLPAIAFEGYAALPAVIFDASNLLFNAVSFLPFVLTDPIRENVLGDQYLFVRYVWAVKVEVAFYAVLFTAILLRGWISALSKSSRWAGVAAAVGLVIINEVAFELSFDLKFAGYFGVGVVFYFWHKGLLSAWLLAVPSALAGLHAVRFFEGAPGPLALLCVCGLIAAALSQARLSSAAASLDQRLGDISYSLYLNHYTVLVAYSGIGAASGGLEWAIVVVASVVLAIVLHLVVERPLAGLRDRIRGQGIQRLA